METSEYGLAFKQAELVALYYRDFAFLNMVLDGVPWKDMKEPQLTRKLELEAYSLLVKKVHPTDKFFDDVLSKEGNDKRVVACVDSVKKTREYEVMRTFTHQAKVKVTVDGIEIKYPKPTPKFP